jgi:hypothetical protein
MGKAHSASYLLRPALLSLTLLLLAGYAALASGAADHVGPREAAKLMQENAGGGGRAVLGRRSRAPGAVRQEAFSLRNAASQSFQTASYPLARMTRLISSGDRSSSMLNWPVPSPCRE